MDVAAIPESGLALAASAVEAVRHSLLGVIVMGLLISDFFVRLSRPLRRATRSTGLRGGRRRTIAGLEPRLLTRFAVATALCALAAWAMICPALNVARAVHSPDAAQATQIR